MGHYIAPEFSPNGQWVVFRRTGGDALRRVGYSREQGIYIVGAQGGEPTLVTREGNDPRFTRSGTRVFLSASEGDKPALISVNLTGGERRVHLIAENATQFAPSPDETYIAWVERSNAYVAPFTATGRAVTIRPVTTDISVRRVSRDAGTDLHWSSDSRQIYWALGPALFTRDLSQTFAFETADSTTVRKEPEPKGMAIGFRAPFARPTETVALTGATAITMNGREVIRNATIVVDGNRITAIGPSGKVPVPAGTRRIDLSGKYVAPGFVDAHAHIGTGSSGVTAVRNPQMLTAMAFGVTTMHDPSNSTDMIFSASEMVKSGAMPTAPRLFSTGTILYGAEGNIKAVTTTFEDALTHLRRMKAVGAFSVKSYNQPRRDARQQIIEAARQLGMEVVPEGGSTFFFNMTHILDGHTTVEHNLPVAPLYQDALRIFAASKTAYTLTLIVNYNGLSGEYYWYAYSDVWKDERLRRFAFPGALEARARRREVAAEDDYSYQASSRSAKALNDLGVKVNTGVHGKLQGLGLHWEMWMLSQGGMTPHEVLRTATINGAELLGLDRDIGSLAKGKLADLLVLDKNPLDNIRNSTAIRCVMANGRLYDAATMTPVRP